MGHTAIDPNETFAFIHHGQESIPSRTHTTKDLSVPIALALGHLGFVKVVHLIANPLVQFAVGQGAIGAHLAQLLDQEVGHSPMLAAALAFAHNMLVGLLSIAAAGH